MHVTVTLPRADTTTGHIDIDTDPGTARLLRWLADYQFRPHAFEVGDDRFGVLFDDGRDRGVWGLIEITPGGRFLRASVTDDGADLTYDPDRDGMIARSALFADLRFLALHPVSGGTVLP